MIDLLARRREMMGASGGSLPYDAQVEYLKGDGHAYIDLGTKGNLNTIIYVECETPSEGTYQCIAGSRSSNTNAITLIYGHNQSNAWRFGAKTASVSLSDDTSYIIQMDKNGVTVNGSTTSYSQTASFTTEKNLQVFFAGNIGLSKFTGMVRAFKLYDSAQLVIDLIPVRVGTTGYMYDRVSGTLFGNAGTGDFILGNDKN